jgi:tetratricopeptide (TPR) repeat protein
VTNEGPNDRSAVTTAGPQPGPVPAEPPDAATGAVRIGSVFVGREREMGELCATAEDVLRNSGRLVLLSGEPGIGKTRTALELARHARTRGFQVLSGRSHETGGAPAYWPWVQAIRAYVASASSVELEAAMGTGAAYVAQLVAEIRDRLPALPTPQSVDPEQARFHLFDGITTFLNAVAAKHPLFILLEDLHAADKSSLLLLQFLTREIVDSRILVVATYRDAEVDRDHPLFAILGELAREPATRRLALTGLGEQAIARHIELTAGAPASATMVGAIFRKTEGNPFFAGEVVRLLLAEGALDRSWTDAEWRTVIPAGVRGVILHRLGRLSAECGGVLTLAAVIGRDFGLNVLERASGRPAAELLTALEEAESARVIGELPGALGRYAFSHALIQETLYGELGPRQRMRLHHKVGEALEAVYRAHPETALTELAYHFSAAAPGGGTDRAIDYAVRAGNRALALMAYEEAARHYELALRALELNAEPDGGLLSDLLIMLSDALWSAGEFDRGKAVALRAVEVARSLEWPAQVARAALGYAGHLPAFGAVATDETVLALLEGALAGLAEGESGLRARLMARLAEELTLSPSHERRWRLSREAMDLARRNRDRGVLASVLRSTYWGLWVPEAVEDWVAVATEIIELGEQGGDRALALEGYILRLIAFIELGDAPTIQREFQRCERWATEVKQPYLVWIVAMLRGCLALLEGRVHEVEGFAHAALALGEQAQNKNAPLFFGIQLAHLFWLHGRFAEVETGLIGLGALYPLVTHTSQAGLAITYSEQGRVAEARAQFEAVAGDDLASLPRHVAWLCTTAFLAEVCVFLDDTARAETLYAMLLPFESRWVTLPPAIPFGAADHYLGALSATLGRWENATRHFENAIAMEKRLGTEQWLARTQVAYAAMLVGRGVTSDRPKAAGLLDAALETAVSLVMPTVAERARALRLSLGEGNAGAPDAVPPPSGGGPSVFRREGEIWTVAYGGRVHRLKDAKGLRYIATLLRHAGRELPATEVLLAALGGAANAAPEARASGDVGPILDAEAKRQYRQRLADLRSDLDEADRFGDIGRAEALREEIDILSDQVSAAVGLGGRDRIVGSPGERARLTVTKGIKAVLQKIRQIDPVLGHHLNTHIRTGGHCVYNPDPEHPVDWNL